MSVDVLEQAAAESRSPASRDDFAYSQLNEFNYRPVPVTAVAGLVLALLSAMGLFLWMVLPLSGVAVLLSLLGFWTIRSSQGAYSGKGVALSGILLGATFLLGGIGFQVYQYQTERPEGFERVSFLKDISEKKLVQINDQVLVHPDVARLDGQEVFIKGYMYQSSQTRDINRFMFVKDNRDCCFGANPAIWDQLWVTLQDNKTINLTTGKVAVAGKFRINREWNPADKTSPLYLIDGERFITRVSDF